MIAHVAEAGEDRGRVVVRLGACAPSIPAALAAAIHVARAYQSQIEAIFVEDPDVIATGSHDWVRTLSTTGNRRSSPGAGQALAADLNYFALAAQREVAGLAKAAGVAFSGQVVRGGTIPALSAACSERGPWNIIAFAEPVSTPDRAGVLNEALTRVWGTTAFLASGRQAQWRSGPVLAVVEDIERLAGLMRASERLAAIGGDDVLLLPAAQDEIALDWLESEIRLTLREYRGVKLLARSEPAGQQPALLEAVAKLSPRIVLARHGGQLVPTVGTDRALAALACPVFIVH